MDKNSRLALHYCLDSMWESFWSSVPPGDPKIKRFIFLKNAAQEILAEEAEKDYKEGNKDDSLQRDATEIPENFRGGFPV